MSAGEQTRPFGPVMMLVVGFDRSHFKGEILPELRRLSDEGIIRVLDLMVVAKHENGDLEALQESDLTTEEAQELGAIIGALVGFGHGGEEEAYSAAVAGAAEGEDGHILPDAEVWYLADAIPDGTTAAIALIEHTLGDPAAGQDPRRGRHPDCRRVDPSGRPGRDRAEGSREGRRRRPDEHERRRASAVLDRPPPP